MTLRGQIAPHRCVRVRVNIHILKEKSGPLPVLQNLRVCEGRCESHSPEAWAAAERQGRISQDHGATYFGNTVSMRPTGREIVARENVGPSECATVQSHIIWLKYTSRRSSAPDSATTAAPGNCYQRAGGRATSVQRAHTGEMRHRWRMWRAKQWSQRPSWDGESKPVRDVSETIGKNVSGIQRTS